MLAIGATWTAAAAQAYYAPLPGQTGVIDGLVRFHETINPSTLGLYVLGMLAALFVGRMSFRKDAKVRVAGA